MIETFTPKVGVERACAAFGIAPRTYRHRRQHAQGRGRPRPSRASGRPRAPHPARIDDAERQRIVGVLCEPRFVDLAPAQVYATLLDEGVYLCSIRQMYRLLHERDLVGERRRGHAPRKTHAKPRVHAQKPNQAWSWDISRLAGPARREWFYAYVLLDIFSRAIVGHTVETTESDLVAERLIATTATRQGIDRDQLVLHSDRGPQMTSMTIAELLEDLGVTRSLSRPRVSNDNPFSEANFKTAKYRPDYPDRFEDLTHARAWFADFVAWYNEVHYHSGVGLHHPADVHDGSATAIRDDRQQILDAAYAAHPERFTRPPTAPRLPAHAWINKPEIRNQTRPN
jgi:putative transposase